MLHNPFFLFFFFHNFEQFPLVVRTLSLDTHTQHTPPVKTSGDTCLLLSIICVNRMKRTREDTCTNCPAIKGSENKVTDRHGLLSLTCTLITVNY